MTGAHLLGIGVVVAFFDAFGIGANDVANSFATSVNSGVFTMTQAAIVAVIFEFLGAILAGGRVSKTVQKGILSASKFKGQEGLMQVGFVCALIGSATWLQLANYFALPVSTTHSIIGGVIGIGIAAFGADAIQWGFSTPKAGEAVGSDGFGPIAVSWVLSPFVAGAFAATMFALTKYLVLQNNAVSTRIHKHSFWRAVFLAPFFYGFVAAILVLLLAFKGVSANANAGGLATISSSKQSLGLASGLTALVVTILASVWISWWQVRTTWNGEQLKWYEWFYHPFVCKRPVIPGFDTTHKDVEVKPAALQNSTPLPEAAVTPMPQTPGDALDTATLVSITDSTPKKQADSLALKLPDLLHDLIAPELEVNLTLETTKIKVVPKAIQDAMAIAEAEGYIVREMGETEKVTLEYKRMCLRGSWLDRLLCPFRAVFCHGIRGADGKERIIRHHAENDPQVKVMHDLAAKYDDKTEIFFKQLQMTTSIIASFAHGSNDVANAMGPFSVIYGVYAGSGSASGGWPTPDWILAFGGISIGIGFIVYGFHLMRSLGNTLTYHSPSRGYCMEFGAAITVILASQIGLPISTTQCITGATIAIGLMSGLRAVNWRRMANIFLSWIFTVPVVAILSGLIFSFVIYSPNLKCGAASCNST